MRMVSQPAVLKHVLKAFSSVQTTIALLGYGICLFIIITLIPQRMDSVYYQTVVPQPLADIILFTGLDNFQTSLLFLVPAILFLIHLIFCYLRRTLRLLKKNKKTSLILHVPDIIHIGVFLICIGGFISLMERYEEHISLSPGESIQLEKNTTLLLKNTYKKTDKKGKIINWVSSFQLENSKDKKINVSVNNPKKINQFMIYQTNWEKIAMLFLEENATGRVFSINPNEGFLNQQDERFIYLGKAKTDQPDTAVFLFESKKVRKKMYKKTGNSIGPFSVVDITMKKRTTITVVKDPGTIYIFIGLIVLSIGSILLIPYRTKKRKRQT